MDTQTKAATLFMYCSRVIQVSTLTCDTLLELRSLVG